MRVGTHPCAVATSIYEILERQSSLSRGVPGAELGQFGHNDHCSLLTAGAAGEVQACSLSMRSRGDWLGISGRAGLSPRSSRHRERACFLVRLARKLK